MTLEDALNKNIRIVLVEPQESLNVGSVARAMKNLGFKDLILVSPRSFDPAKAAITACAAADVLDTLTIVESLHQALEPVETVVGFSARSGKNRVEVVDLPHFTQEYITSSPGKRAALVFGPEDTGLRQEHLELCRLVVSIPAFSEYTSYNLSQAVLLALYSLRNEERRVGHVDVQKQNTSVPTWNDFYQLDRLVLEALERVEFIRDGTPAPIPGVVKGLLRRIDPSTREMGILLGMFGKINRVLALHEIDARNKNAHEDNYDAASEEK
jgi:TrmH family RNA methyltransferase